MNAVQSRFNNVSLPSELPLALSNNTGTTKPKDTDTTQREGAEEIKKKREVGRKRKDKVKESLHIVH